MQAVDNPTDPRLAALAALAGPQFRRWWAARYVAPQEFGNKTVRHPDLGDLTIDRDSFQWAGDPDRQLIMWSAEPLPPTHGKLRVLASRIKGPPPSTRDTTTGHTDT